MKVITFDRDLFRAECRRLGELALSAFDPELVVGIRSGGYVVAEAMLDHEPPQSRRLLPITRRRSSSALKEKNGLARSVVKALPYAVTDRIRVLEHRMLTRRRGSQPPAPSRWEADPAEADALASALGETPAARVLVVDDALDTGTTLKAVVELLQALAPASTVRSAVIVTTTADPVISADISLHNRVLGRFPWSHDFKN